MLDFGSEKKEIDEYIYFGWMAENSQSNKLLCLRERNIPYEFMISYSLHFIPMLESGR